MSTNAASQVSNARVIVEHGSDLIANPILNKGTAFSHAERDAFSLHGILPVNVSSLDEQVERRLSVLRSFSTDLERYAFLRDLQDTNETLFYALLSENTEELLPIVYTPTVGQACENFSTLYRRPRGIFLSPATAAHMDSILANPVFDDVEVIVVTDGERILGLGDQGAGGMGIPIGKLALYSACGGINPATTLPIMLDVGTNNAERIADPRYVGWRNARIVGEEYDAFIDQFVSAVKRRWPNVMLQWEDFAKDNATRLLERYRDELCTFNDDVQGTAAVATATLLSAVTVTGTSIADQRIAIMGAGSAGCGIASMLCLAMVDAGLSLEEALSRFYLLNSKGLMVKGMANVASFQAPFLQDASVKETWSLETAGTISLHDVVVNAAPTALIGVSGQPGSFPEQVIRLMAKQNKRPIIFPLSNPTSRAEATPADIDLWTEGQAIIGTGSPFPALVRQGRRMKVDQTNNSYIFPGLGLGVLAVKAHRISDKMMMAAAKALAKASPTVTDKTANLLPAISDLQDVSLKVAEAVALQAIAEGLCYGVEPKDVKALVAEKFWHPSYRAYVKYSE